MFHFLLYKEIIIYSNKNKRLNIKQPYHTLLLAICFSMHL